MITGPLFSPLASCRTSPLLFFSPAYFDVWNSSNFHASFLQINKMCQIKSVHVSFFTKQYFAIKWHVAILQCPGFRDATSPTVFHDLPLQPFWSHCWLEPAKLVAVHHSRLDCKTWQFCLGVCLRNQTILHATKNFGLPSSPEVRGTSFHACMWKGWKFVPSQILCQKKSHALHFRWWKQRAKNLHPAGTISSHICSLFISVHFFHNLSRACFNSSSKFRETSKRHIKIQSTLNHG